MGVDWVMRVYFRITYTDGGILRETTERIFKNEVGIYEYTNMYQEIKSWEELNPVTRIYENGKWTLTEHVTVPWGDASLRHWNRDIIHMLYIVGIDINNISTIDAVPVGDDRDGSNEGARKS
jgi:hypothetical protein